MLNALWESFYSAALYRRIQHWRGKGLVYLAFILVLCWASALYKVHKGINFIFLKAQTEVIPKLPEIHFEHGQITTTENRPYLFRFGGTQQTVFAIIDTSGQYKTLEGQQAQMLLTKDHFYVRQNKNGEIRSYDLSQSKNRPMTLNQDFLLRILHRIRGWVIGATYVGILVMSYLKRLIQAFVIALLGLILTSMLDSDLDLGELFSLAIVAMTPAMIFETLLTLSGKSFRFQWILWFLLIAGYFLFAVNAASDITEPTETPS